MILETYKILAFSGWLIVLISVLYYLTQIKVYDSEDNND